MSKQALLAQDKQHQTYGKGGLISIIAHTCSRQLLLDYRATQNENQTLG